MYTINLITHPESHEYRNTSFATTRELLNYKISERNGNFL